MKTARKLYYWCFIIYLSFKWLWRINLGDEVIYNGKIYIVSNGVRLESWRLRNYENEDNGWVNRKDCKKLKTVSNYFGSIRSGYDFYMRSWFEIWVDKGIEEWMRNCRIW